MFATNESNISLTASNQFDVEKQPELLNFLQEWDNNYNNELINLPLFDIKKTAQWSIQQKIHFVRVFYHCRGHFHELLWFLANYAPDKKSKNIIIENIVEELGENGFSHEQLYSFSANAVGVDITEEYIEQKTYLPFCKEFNQGHLKWLRDNDWHERISAFAALERLDNIDYKKGKALAESLGLKGKELTFFNAHIHVDHFGSVIRGAVGEIWQKDPGAVKDAFDFISAHQTKMWHNLSEEIFNYVS